MSDPLTPEEAWATLRDSLSKAYVAADIDAALASARPMIERATLDAERAAQGGLREAARTFVAAHDPRTAAAVPCKADCEPFDRLRAALAAQPTPTLDGALLAMLDGMRITGDEIEAAITELGPTGDRAEAYVKVAAQCTASMLRLRARLANVTAPEPSPDA